MSIEATGSAVLEITGLTTLLLTPPAWLLRRPRLEMRAKRWVPKDPVQWQFAAIDIRNRAALKWTMVARQPIIGATVTLEFRRDGALAFDPVPARWSARPEPIRMEPIPVAPGHVQLVPFPAPELVPQSLTYDLQPNGRWEEVAIAVLRDGDAYAWGAESYNHNWANPEWKLQKGQYDVTVHLQHSAGEERKDFVLRYLSDDFNDFNVTEEGEARADPLPRPPPHLRIARDHSS